MSKSSLYHILVVGDPQTGKTALLHRWLTGEFLHQYTIHSTSFHSHWIYTNYGWVQLEFQDYPSTLKDSLPHSSETEEANGALIFFDLSRKDTYSSVSNWHALIQEIAGDIPVVVCGSKFDLQTGSSEYVTHHLKYPQVDYTSVSAKSNYHLDRPIILLLRRLIGKDVSIQEAPPLED